VILAAAADGASAGGFSPVALTIGVLLLAVNGFFTAAEISLLAARRGRIEEAAEAGERRAVWTLEALTDLRTTFSGAQLGITMTSIGLGVVAEPAVEALVATGLAATRLPAAVTPALSFALALAVVVLLHMVVGDMAPKNLAIARTESVALALGRPLRWFVLMFRPLIVILNGATRLQLRLVRVEPVDEHKLVHTPEELVLVLSESRELGTIPAQDAPGLGGGVVFNSTSPRP
jgi:CBS domain containing-hemolysin-like protein